MPKISMGDGRQYAPLQSHALCQIFEELQSALELRRLVEQRKPALTNPHPQEGLELNSRLAQIG